jgi:hypothetical protein
MDLARGWLEQTENRAASCSLSAARLSNDAERLAARNVERHVVDGFDGADLSRKDALLDRELLSEIPDGEQSVAVPGISGLSACRHAAPTPWQRDVCPVPMS